MDRGEMNPIEAAGYDLVEPIHNAAVAQPGGNAARLLVLIGCVIVEYAIPLIFMAKRDPALPTQLRTDINDVLAGCRAWTRRELTIVEWEAAVQERFVRITAARVKLSDLDEPMFKMIDSLTEAVRSLDPEWLEGNVSPARRQDRIEVGADCILDLFVWEDENAVASTLYEADRSRSDEEHQEAINQIIKTTISDNA